MLRNAAIRETTGFPIVLKSCVLASPWNFILFVFFLGGCVSIDSEYNTGTHSQDTLLVSTDGVVNMGKGLEKEIAKQAEVSQNPADIARINKIGKKIADVCDRQEVSYYFDVITVKKSEEDKNAFCIPGGHVYVFKALFDNLNDDELAFVLAHEIGHIVCRHHIKQMQAQYGANFLMLASIFAPHDDPDFVPAVAFALDSLMVSYSREDELKADELAVKYMKLTGFNPQAGISVMEKLYQDGKKRIEPFSYFRTHPYTGCRVAHIKQLLNIPLGPADYVNLQESK